MSELGSIYDVLDSLGPDGSVAYSRGAWMQAAANAGQSFNQTYNQMVGTPLGLRRDQALSIWQGLQERITSGETASQLPFDAVSGIALPGTAPDNWTGQYRHTVMFTVRTPNPGGGYSLENLFRSIKGSSVLTPAEATDYGLQILSTSTTGSPELPDVSQVISTGLVGVQYVTSPGLLSGAGVGGGAP